jgi:diguanylate cyclase (GGDEF)-like protein
MDRDTLELKNTNTEALERRIFELEALVRELEGNLIHDSLTGLKTRSFFEEEVSIYLDAIAYNNEGKRKEWFGFRNLSIIFFDLDHFKNINDKHGHAIGDVVLKRSAEIIKTSLRSGDTACRWGGEEILVSLLGANEIDAVMKADEIRTKIESLRFEEAPELRITISSGVASSESGINLDELVRRADQALYRAKNAGRNRTVSFSNVA